MQPRVYIETTIPSFYFEVRTEPEMVARCTWTRTWWDQRRQAYQLVTSVAVLDDRKYKATFHAGVPPAARPPAATPHPGLLRAVQRIAAAPPEGPRSQAERGCGWCWTGGAGGGRVAPQACPGGTASGRAAGKGGGQCRWMDEWQPVGDPSQAHTQSLRCYTPADFLLLLEGTGLALVRLGVAGEPLDVASPHTMQGPLREAYSYLVQLQLPAQGAA